MNTQRIGICLDASSKNGLGHLTRCAVLADALATAAEVVFVIRTDRLEFVRRRISRYRIEHVNPTASLSDEFRTLDAAAARAWVVDHYRADTEYQASLPSSGFSWLQFDWAAEFELNAHLVLNAGPAASHSSYQSLIAPYTRLLLGPDYALVPASILEHRRPAAVHEVSEIVVCLGGGDDSGHVARILEELQCSSWATAFSWHVFTTSANPQRSHWRHSSNVTIHVDSDQLWARATRAGVVLCAGGVTAQEMLALGVAVAILPIAENQVPNATAWQQRFGVACTAGMGNVHDALECVRRLSVDRELRGKQHSRACTIFDGRGPERVANEFLTQVL